MQLTENEIKELINRFPECPVEKLIRCVNDFDGSTKGLDELYSILKWIESHEVKLSKLRRTVEKKIIDQRFKDVKV